MQVPNVRGIALLLTAALAACDTKVTSTGFAGGTTATVRVVNATPGNIDVASSGTVGTSDGGLAFGTASSCAVVDASAPNLSVRTAGTGNVAPGFPAAFTAGGKYIVVAYADAGGVTRFATFATNTFTPGNAQAGLRVFDAATGAGSFDVYVNPPGSALGTASATSLVSGTSTSFFSVDAGSQQVRLTNAGTQTIAFDSGALTLGAGRNYVLVVGSPVTGSTLPSALVPSC